MAQHTFNNTKINVEFDESTSRQQLNSGENISTLFGKIKKIFSDLKSVCFSGSYNDLSDTPTTATTDTDGLMSASDKSKLDKVSNPNLLINPDFSINQRGVSGVFSETGKYFVDRWRLVSGTVTVNSDGTLTLDGSICQPLENAAGANVTASVSAGTAVYDDTAKTFTITGNGDVISWAKLETGIAATDFSPPDPVAELMKCYRFFYRVGRTIATPNQNANVSRISYQKTSAKYVGCAIRFPIEMRVAPTATISGTPWCFRLFTNDAANAVVAGADSVIFGLQKCGYDIRITNDYFANAVDGFIAPLYTSGYTDFDAEL